MSHLDRKYKCPECGRRFKGRFPKGGDGLQFKLYPHRRSTAVVGDTESCPGSDVRLSLIDFPAPSPKGELEISSAHEDSEPGSTHFHMHASKRWVIREIRKHGPVKVIGMDVPVEDAIAMIEADPRQYIPFEGCDNRRADGSCGGHRTVPRLRLLQGGRA